MVSEPRILRLLGVPASAAIAALPLGGEDMSFCLDVLERLEGPDPQLCDQACAELERFIGSLVLSAIALQALLDRYLSRE